jgi:hypothetical protein
MLPKSDDLYALISQFVIIAAISQHIAINFGIPIRPFAFWADKAFRATMPETTVNEYRYSARREIEIWPAGNFIFYPIISETTAPNSFSEDNLRHSISCSYFRHAIPSLFRRQSVHCAIIPHALRKSGT